MKQPDLKTQEALRYLKTSVPQFKEVVRWIEEGLLDARMSLDATDSATKVFHHQGASVTLQDIWYHIDMA